MVTTEVVLHVHFFVYMLQDKSMATSRGWNDTLVSTVGQETGAAKAAVPLRSTVMIAC